MDIDLFLNILHTVDVILDPIEGVSKWNRLIFHGWLSSFILEKCHFSKEKLYIFCLVALEIYRGREGPPQFVVVEMVSVLLFVVRIL